APVALMDANAAATVPAPATGAWLWIALGFALLWLATLAWALRRPRQPAEAPARHPPPAQTPATSARALQRVLAAGDPAEVEQALSALATPPAASLEALSQRIADPRQRGALLRLQQARWADGDIAEARRALREAFAQGPAWSGGAAPADPATELLPPLYPGHRAD